MGAHTSEHTHLLARKIQVSRTAFTVKYRGEAFVMSLNGRPRSRLWRTGTVPLTQHARARSHERQSQPLRPAVLPSRHEGAASASWRVCQERGALPFNARGFAPNGVVPHAQSRARPHTAVSSSVLSSTAAVHVCVSAPGTGCSAEESSCRPKDRSANCRKKLCCRSPPGLALH